MVELYLPRPVSEDMYYETYISVEQRNRRRCDDLKLENKLGTHSWDKRVNLIFYGVSDVETYNFSTQYIAYEDTFRVFFCALDVHMIDKDIGSRPTRLTSKITGRSSSSIPFRKRVAAHLFQTYKKIRLQNGIFTTYHKKGGFRIFQMKTTRMRSLCHMEYP